MTTTNPTKLFRSVAQALLLGTIIAGTALSQGCFLVAVGAAGAAGAGAVAYVRGELDATVGNSYEATLSATNRALTDLQFARISETKDAFNAVLVARSAIDKKIEIKLTKSGEGLTRVQIRIGTFGDEPMSRAILDKIKSNL